MAQTPINAVVFFCNKHEQTEKAKGTYISLVLSHIVCPRTLHCNIKRHTAMRLYPDSLFA